MTLPLGPSINWQFDNICEIHHIILSVKIKQRYNIKWSSYLVA